jgi:hypothetical protein
MTKPRYCIVHGSFSEGFSVTGPFDSEVEANKWAAATEAGEHEPYTVEMLYDPEDALYEEDEE